MKNVIPLLVLSLFVSENAMASELGGGDGLTQFPEQAYNDRSVGPCNSPASHEWPTSTVIKAELTLAETSATILAPENFSTVAANDAFALLDKPTDGAGSVTPVSLLPASYSAGEFVRELKLVPRKTLGVVGGTLAMGLVNWKWGGAKFHFVDEGWFGDNTKALGMDKLGHVYGTATIANFMTIALKRKVDNRSAALTGSLFAMGIMTFVELGDGISDYGFSMNDIAADTVGATFAYFRNTIPGLREKLDYRFEYIPSNNGAYRPWSDYSGQKYLMAVKLSGWHRFERTPLRFVELNAGYYARGFTTKEELRGDPLRRRFFFGIGLNVEQLLMGSPRRAESENRELVREGLRGVQVPYTYTSANVGL